MKLKNIGEAINFYKDFQNGARSVQELEKAYNKLGKTGKKVFEASTGKSAEDMAKYFERSAKNADTDAADANAAANENLAASEQSVAAGAEASASALAGDTAAKEANAAASRDAAAANEALRASQSKTSVSGSPVTPAAPANSTAALPSSAGARTSASAGGDIVADLESASQAASNCSIYSIYSVNYFANIDSNILTHLAVYSFKRLKCLKFLAIRERANIQANTSAIGAA